MDTLELALVARNTNAANFIKLMAMCRLLAFDREAFEQALLSSIPPKTVEMNKKAFELGYAAVSEG